MKDISEDPDFTVQLWDADEQIDLRLHGSMTELRPVEFHAKEDGDTGGNPSFCFVLVDDHAQPYNAQISERMVAPALKAMGYVKVSEENDPPSFTCPDCGMTSYNPNDITNQYCGACHEWKSSVGDEDHAKGEEDFIAAFVAEYERRWRSRTPTTDPNYLLAETRVDRSEMEDWVKETYGMQNWGLIEASDPLLVQAVFDCLTRLKKEFPGECGEWPTQ